MNDKFHHLYKSIPSSLGEVVVSPIEKKKSTQRIKKNEEKEEYVPNKRRK